MTAAQLTPAAITKATANIGTALDSIRTARQGEDWLPTIGYISKALGAQTAAAVVKLQLIALNMTTNAARPMTEAVIEAMAPEIVRHMLDAAISYNVADIRIIFDRGRAGYYGKLYGGVGLQDICAWLDAYEQEKIDAIDRLEAEKKQNNFAERTSLSASAERDLNHAAQVWYQQMKGGQQ